MQDTSNWKMYQRSALRGISTTLRQSVSHASTYALYAIRLVLISVSGTLTTSGIITLGTPDNGSVGSGQLTVGSLNIAATGGIELLTAGGVRVNGDLINAGGIESVGSGGDGLTVRGNVTNTGGITVDGSTSIGGNVTNSALFSTPLTNSGGDTVTVGGNFINTSAGTLSIFHQGTTVNLTNLSNEGVVDIENYSQLNVSKDVVNSGRMLVSDTGSFPDALAVAGTLTNNAGGLFVTANGEDIVNIGHVSNAGTMQIFSVMTVTGGAHAGGNAIPGFLNTGVVQIYNGSNQLLELRAEQPARTTSRGWQAADQR